MIPMIAGAALNIGGQLWNSAKTAKATKDYNNKVNASLNQSKGDIDAYFNNEYHKNYLDTDESKATLEAVRRGVEENNKRLGNQFSASGATPEAQIAANQAGNAAYSNAVLRLFGSGQAYKSRAKERYMGMLSDWRNQRLAADTNAYNSQMANYAQSAQNVGNAAGGIMQAAAAGGFDEIFNKDNQ